MSSLRTCQYLKQALELQNRVFNQAYSGDTLSCIVCGLLGDTLVHLMNIMRPKRLYLRFLWENSVFGHSE